MAPAQISALGSSAGAAARLEAELKQEYLPQLLKRTLLDKEDIVGVLGGVPPTSGWLQAAVDLGLWDDAGGDVTDGSTAASSTAGRWRDLRLSRGEARSLAGKRHARGHNTALSLLFAKEAFTGSTVRALWDVMCRALHTAGAPCGQALFEARAVLHSAQGLAGAALVPAAWAGPVEEAARKRRRTLALAQLAFVSARLAGCGAEEMRGTLAAENADEEEEEE